MNVCDFCGAYCEGLATCSNCMKPHTVLHWQRIFQCTEVAHLNNRLEAERWLENNPPVRHVDDSIVILPTSLWVEGIENLLDWRP